MHKKIIIVFWGNPFFDARCMNMVDEFLDYNHQVSVLGIAKEAQKIKHRDAKIVLMNTKKFNNSITKYFKYFNCVKKLFCVKITFFVRSPVFVGYRELKIQFNDIVVPSTDVKQFVNEIPRFTK